MNRQFAAPLALALACAAFCAPAQAQFSRLLDSVKNRVEDKAAEKVESMMQPQAAGSEPQAAPSRALAVRAASDFVPGNRVLLQESFTETRTGAMPRGWQTNGSGRVVEVEQIPGHWLETQAGAVYKLARRMELPERFTVEFELLALADRIDDLNPVKFGFAPDNSVADNRPINGVSLQYYNEDRFLVTSSATDYYHPSDFDLRGYANRVMPVAISVDGDQMRVYLDGQKIADARLFRGNPTRQFYLEAPLNMNNGSRLAFGNVRIAAFSEDIALAD